MRRIRRLTALFLLLATSGWTAKSIQHGGRITGFGSSGNASWKRYSVAISHDGNTAIVGGLLDGGNSGAAWVLTRSDGVWSPPVVKLAGVNAVGNAGQGFSV